MLWACSSAATRDGAIGTAEGVGLGGGCEEELWQETRLMARTQSDKTFPTFDHFILLTRLACRIGGSSWCTFRNSTVSVPCLHNFVVEFAVACKMILVFEASVYL